MHFSRFSVQGDDHPRTFNANRRSICAAEFHGFRVHLRGLGGALHEKEPQHGGQTMTKMMMVVVLAMVTDKVFVIHDRDRQKWWR